MLTDINQGGKLRWARKKRMAVSTLQAVCMKRGSMGTPQAGVAGGLGQATPWDLSHSSHRFWPGQVSVRSWLHQNWW